MLQHYGGLDMELALSDWRLLLDLALSHGWAPAGARRLGQGHRDPFTGRVVYALLDGSPACDLASYCRAGIQLDVEDLAGLVAAVPLPPAGSYRPQIDPTLAELRLAITAGEPVFLT